jgi:outer membrane protein assembly factor BamE (lipoprotein component of BamABCDE complex)
MYQSGQNVIVKKCETIKIISDSEIIDNIEIYYMSDNTSYSKDQIIEISPNDVFNHILKSSTDNIKKVSKFMTEKAVENFVFPENFVPSKHCKKEKNFWEILISFIF